MVSEKQVLDALSVIIDPDLGRDIVSLGFIKELKIEGGAVSFTVELTTPACPIKAKFQASAEEAVSALAGVESVQVTMSARRSQRPAKPQGDVLENVGAVIAVSSCKGGVGKSTVAAHLARAIQREGYQVGLLDVDLYGPSLPTLFNVHDPEVFSVGDLIQPIEVDGLKTMSLGYMIGDKPAVMRGPMASNYLIQLLQQTEWGTLDYLIIDMPPGTGDVQLTLVQQAALDGAIIVTTPQALSLVDVARGIIMFEKVNVPVLGVVENMTSFICDNCNKEHFLFGSSASTLKERFGLDTLAKLPIMPGISSVETKASGSEIAAFAQLAENLHREVGMRRITDTAKAEVIAEPGFILVRWPDGKEDRIANKTLRASCQCASCKHEMTGEPILDPATIPDDIQAESIEALGHYAVSIAWTDGHSSGIFSWDHLRQVIDESSKGQQCCGDCHCQH